MTITEKRAVLFRAWQLVMHANDDGYYYDTLYTGIPDGDTIETVLSDLRDGSYDDDIDEMLKMYNKNLIRAAWDGGFYIGGIVYYSEEEVVKALKATGFCFPTRIYRDKIVY